MLLQVLLASVVIGCGYSEYITLQWPADSPCIMIKANASNTLMWNYNDTEVISKPLSFIEYREIDGSCNETAFHELQLKANNTFKFVFEDKNGQVTVNMSVEFVPYVIFGDAGNNDTDPVTLSTTMTTGFANHSYVCDQEKVYEVKIGQYGLNLTFMYLKIQGFGITNGSWSEEEPCAATTTLSPTTAPTTPKPVSPDQHDYLTYNTSCVLLAGEMQWTIPYNGMSKSVQIGLHSSTLSYFNASCNKFLDEDVLHIWFYDATWVMFITFGGNLSTFWWKSVSLSYILDESHFPGINNTENGTIHKNNTFGIHLFEAQRNGSYLCNSSTKIDLADGFSLSTWNLQYMALQENVTAFSSQHVTECRGVVLPKKSSVIAIAVGAALGGLVVIVLVAYLIGRRRSKKHYESV